MPRYPSDTDPETEAKQIELLRKATVAQRIACMRSLTGTVMWLAKRGIKRANPDLSQKELDLLFVRVHYGDEMEKWVRDCMENPT